MRTFFPAEFHVESPQTNIRFNILLLNLIAQFEILFVNEKKIKTQLNPDLLLNILFIYTHFPISINCVIT